MIKVSILKRLADHRRFVEWLVVVLQCWHQTEWVEREERLGLMVRVHLDILVWSFIFFEGYPDALHKGATSKMGTFYLHLRHPLDLVRHHCEPSTFCLPEVSP